MGVIIALLLSTTYYVDKDGVHGTKGNDNYSGRSWQEPWATLTKAANTLTAGDSVIIARAVYREEVQPRNSGSPGNWITYLGEDGVEVSGGEPVDETRFTKVSGYNYTYRLTNPGVKIQTVYQLKGPYDVQYRPFFEGFPCGPGEDDTLPPPVDPDPFDPVSSLAEVDYIKHNGSWWFDSTHNVLYIHMPDHQPPSESLHQLEFGVRDAVLTIEGKSYIRIENITFRHATRYMANVYGFYLTHCSNIELHKVNIIGTASRFADCSDITLTECKIGRVWRTGYDYNNDYNQRSIPHGSGISLFNTHRFLAQDVYIEYISDVSGIKNDCQDITYERCRWYACDNHGVVIKSEDPHTLPVPTNITFRRCEGGARCQEGIVINAVHNLLIENCDLTYIMDNGWVYTPPFISTNIRIWNTMLHWPRLRSGALLWLREESIDEYHLDYNCLYQPCQPNIWVMVRPSGGGTSQKMTLTEWQAYSGEDQHSINLDPLVVKVDSGPGSPWADYYLTKNSPCIDAGDPSYQPPPGGGSRIDIGAYEYLKNRVNEGKNTSDRPIILPSPIRPGGLLRLKNNFTGVLKIADVSGRIIIKKDLDRCGELPLGSHLRSGIYFIILDGNQRWQEKILVID